jgi:hypothetical protein
MICSAIKGDVPAIRRLLKQDPNLAITEYWYTQPIHFAVREGHLEATQTIIEAGAGPHHLSGHCAHVGDLDLTGYHLVTQRGHDRRHHGQPLLPLVGDQHTQVLCYAIGHRGSESA